MALYVVPPNAPLAPKGAVRPSVALVVVIAVIGPIVGGLSNVVTLIAKVGIDVPFTFVAVRLKLY